MTTDDDDIDMDTSEHNNVFDTNSPLGTTPTPNSTPVSDCESEIELIRPTRSTRRRIDSESSVSGGESDVEDIVVLPDGCVTQEARLVGRQTGGAGAAICLPSPISRRTAKSNEWRYQQMTVREKREVGPTEPLPVECKYNITCMLCVVITYMFHSSTQSKTTIPMQISLLFIDNRDDRLIMTALGSVGYDLAIFTTRASKPLTCGKYYQSLQDCIIYCNGCCPICHTTATVLNV